MKTRKCCVIGHRKINYSDELEKRLEEFVENLIINFNVFTFLFGSKSEFNDLCHKVVTKLKIKYPNLKRVKFTCKSESCTLESEREDHERLISKLVGSTVKLAGYEEEFEFKSKYNSGRASYVERNQAMIDHSDVCVFYFNETYLPPLRKLSKRNSSYYQPKSGTKLSFNYAKQKNKQIFNFYSDIDYQN